MTSGILLYADRLPPLVGGMEMHGGYFIEHFAGHPRFPLLGVVTKDAGGRDVALSRAGGRPAIVFFNSGRWIEDLAELRAAHADAVFVYRTGGNEILKAPLERSRIPDHAARQAFWTDALNATVDLLITNSAFTEGRLRELGVTCAFERCVGGVNVGSLARRPRASGPAQLFCAARFVPYKHHARLLSLVARLVERGIDVRLRLAGDGPLLQEAHARTQRLGLANHVAFLGVLDNRAACAETAAADFYVQLSGDVPTDVPGGRYVHCEGMGRSILEAVSAGTFVIAGRSGALAEVVTPDRGLLLDLDATDDSIVDRMAPLLTSPPRPAPTDEYAWARVFERYERLWEGCLAAAHRH